MAFVSAGPFNLADSLASRHLAANPGLPEKRGNPVSGRFFS
jgi:hypothetical protein